MRVNLLLKTYFFDRFEEFLGVKEECTWADGRMKVMPVTGDFKRMRSLPKNWT